MQFDRRFELLKVFRACQSLTSSVLTTTAKIVSARDAEVNAILAYFYRLFIGLPIQSAKLEEALVAGLEENENHVAPTAPRLDLSALL